MKRRSKIGAILLSICLLLPIFSITSYAASGSVSVTSKSGTVGSSVTITCTVKCSTGKLGTADVVLKYDAAALQYVSGDQGNAGYSLSGQAGSVVYAGVTPSTLTDKFSFTMTFKILKQGSHKVSVTSASAYDIDETAFTPSRGSGTITGTVKTNPKPNNNNTNSNTNNNQNKKDSNNKLAELQVYPGVLSPAFSATTTSYSVEVPGDTKEVTISAKTQSSKATVTVSGGKDLKLGKNAAQVVVVAEDGSSVSYDITIMCGEEEKIQIGDAEHTIDEAFADDKVPTGFSKAKVTYNGREYDGMKNEDGSLCLLNMKKDGETALYIYNQEKNHFYPFLQIAVGEGTYIVPLPIESGETAFADLEATVITVQGKEFDGWKLDEEFGVIPVQNADGEKVFYQYDSVDGTFQRYRAWEDKEVTDVDAPEIPNEYYLYAIGGLGCLVLILAIIVICQIATRKSIRESRKRRRLKRKAQKEQ